MKQKNARGCGHFFCWGIAVCFLGGGLLHLDGEGLAFGQFEVGKEDEIVGVVCAIGGGVAIQIVGYELGFNP